MPDGFKKGCRMMLATATLACYATAATRLFAIETIYGEDLRPDAHRFNGSICLGYGGDPIPIRSPIARWTSWRSESGRGGASIARRRSPRWQVAKVANGYFFFEAGPTSSIRTPVGSTTNAIFPLPKANGSDSNFTPPAFSSLAASSRSAKAQLK
jgi:hypothetical protein